MIATAGDYGPLFPPNVKYTGGRQITELVYDYLTEVGLSLNTFDDRTFATRLARSWEWSGDSMSLAVHLHPEARWHDGKPVRASDVTYSYRIYSDSTFSSMASQLAQIDSVTASDSLTAVFWFRNRYPLQFYDATSQMQILPRHIYGSIPTSSLNEAVSKIKPVGTGRYRFVSENPGQSVELAADTTNYRGTPNITRLIWRVFGGADVAARAFLAGEADVFDVMRPGDVTAAATSPNARVMMSPGSDYAFMTLNLKRPVFASRELRRALTMAVDRNAMIRNVFDSLAFPAIGPTVRYFPSTDPSLKQIEYDPERAKVILDSLGWRTGNSSERLRSRNGQELRFKVILPSSSSNRIKMGTLLQEQLRKVGVALELDQMDFPAFNNRLAQRDFDAALASWHLGTSPAAIRILWTSTAVEIGQNYGAYASKTFDSYVDSAIASFDPERSRSFYTRAYQTAIDDAPAIWLYEPKLVIGIHRRIETRPYRPDAWWWSLADWSIPVSRRIPRD